MPELLRQSPVSLGDKPVAMQCEVEASEGDNGVAAESPCRRPVVVKCGLGVVVERRLLGDNARDGHTDDQPATAPLAYPSRRVASPESHNSGFFLFVAISSLMYLFARNKTL